MAAVAAAAAVSGGGGGCLGCVHVGLLLGLDNVLLIPDPLVPEPIVHLMVKWKCMVNSWRVSQDFYLYLRDRDVALLGQLLFGLF